MSNDLKNSKYWVDKLDLEPHIEGGYFKRIYQSSECIHITQLPDYFSNDNEKTDLEYRYLCTAIYYLLEKGQVSKFHRIKSDETWHFYAGNSLNIYTIQNGKIVTNKLGNNLEKGENFQITVPKNTWFAAEPLGDYTLVGCTVSPGFEYVDFKMATLQDLKNSIDEVNLSELTEETFLKFVSTDSKE
ncbi:putative cupin superfamily sugar epimerase [Methanococcus voltae]|uniref:cupin domain-containing protein n=1 Tax=Methanococcus voltae TaxID=2188 RepID=UPI001AE7FF70|nr:cupin domain-containing protein [Methanococcus voltae]MBP2144030.1 putative cupin superfamily sugar epimerase [Methanococcus voltae]